MAHLTNDQLDWMDDLTSGRFDQGRHRMKNNGKYCCMGVAAERHGMLVKDHTVVTSDQWGCDNSLRSNELADTDIGISVTHLFLPAEINAKLGMTEVDNQILASLNDTHDFNFQQIADFCEVCWVTDTSFEAMRDLLVAEQEQLRVRLRQLRELAS